MHHAASRPGLPALVGSAFSCLCLLAACGGSDPVDPDAGRPDAYTPPADAATTPDAGPGDAGMMCDISVEPAGVPTLTGSYAVIDEAGGSVPHEPTGGNPVGTWIVTSGTAWVSAEQAAMFDMDTSTLSGTAWAVVTDTEITFEFDTLTTLMGTIAGTIRRPSRTVVVGDYGVSGARLVIVPSCFESTQPPDPSGMASLEFTDNADGTGILVTRLMGMAGMTTVVWEATRMTP